MIPAHLVWPLSHLEEPAEDTEWQFEVEMHSLGVDAIRGKQAQPRQNLLSRGQKHDVS